MLLTWKIFLKSLMFAILQLNNLSQISSKFSLILSYSVKSEINVVFKPSSPGQRGIDRKKRTYAMHVEVAYEDATTMKRFLRSCSHARRYPGITRFRVMNEYW